MVDLGANLFRRVHAVEQRQRFLQERKGGNAISFERPRAGLTHTHPRRSACHKRGEPSLTRFEVIYTIVGAEPNLTHRMRF